MFCDPPASGPCVEEYEETTCCGRGLPAEIARQSGRESDLAVRRRKHRLEVGHRGFGLAHEERAGVLMAGENIDCATLAVDV